MPRGRRIEVRVEEELYEDFIAQLKRKNTYKGMSDFIRKKMMKFAYPEERLRTKTKQGLRTNVSKKKDYVQMYQR